jgi:site-specific DNA recombinase
MEAALFYSVDNKLDVYQKFSQEITYIKIELTNIINKLLKYDRETVANRVHHGMQQKVRSGKGLLGSPPPYGYEYRNGALFSNPAEATTVKGIFSAYLSGESMARIARHLTDEGVPTKRSGTWDRKTVARILSNPLYCGVGKWDDVLFEAPHDAIVSVADFNRVQKRKAARARRKGSVFILDGLQIKYI